MATIFDLDQFDDPPVNYVKLDKYPHYKFGDDGTVWSELKNTRLAYVNIDGWHKLIPDIDKYGYPVITLGIYGNALRKKLHQFILEAFVGDCPPDKDVGAHKDGDILNNKSDNLRWATTQENMDDRDLHGNTTRGTKQHLAKINDEIALEIKRRHFGTVKNKYQ